jgi:isochorismate synthase
MAMNIPKTDRSSLASLLHKKHLDTRVDNDFHTLVAQSTAAIERGLFEKVVASRMKVVDLPETFDVALFFIRLTNLYPHALVSLVSSPSTGSWMGATPELLVSTDREMRFKTVALAGTKPLLAGTDIRNVAWTQKDIEEQALVSRYIINCFKKIRLREYEEHGPRTAAAGNVLHLKTEYEVDMQATNFPQLGSTMLRMLHPTSAVCGMPLAPAIDFLQKEEGYNRRFYAGFLGPVNVSGENHMYVNLRCMQLLPQQQASLYAGAGITRDSIPAKEWEETEFKMNTLLQAITE